MKFKLDFTIPTSQERLNFIKTIDLSSLTKKELELCTDYVLYGKDPEKDNTSAVDRKEVFIKTKYNSYSKKEPISLDALMESPTFDENILKKERNIYKKVKPTIDKEQCKDIPGMRELWEEIDRIDRVLKLTQGKIKPDSNEVVPQLSSKEIYVLNHQLIELRKQQYILRDSAFSVMMIQENYKKFYQDPTDLQLNYPVYPCGTKKTEHDKEWEEPYHSPIHFAAIDIEEEIRKRKEENKPYFNFLDKDHIYYLCLNYYEIKDFADKFLDSPLHELLLTLDFYIERANLSQQQRLIVEGKKQRLLNKEICQELEKQLGIHHKENYVSTIWKRTCQLIADAADFHYSEWCCKDYEKAWKKCKCCGRILLKDPHNFVRKNKSADGFTNRCKDCDQKKRRGEI